MKLRNTPKCILFAAATCLLAGPAIASEWAPWDGEDASSPDIVFSDATILACNSNGKMSAVLSTNGSSIKDSLALNAPYARGEEAVINIGDRPSVETMFRYRPARDTIETNRHATVSKLFNAVVRKETVTLNVDRIGEFEADLPEVNSTFKAFAKSCSAARANK